ncbi:MAG: tRNA 4-thiouridine(8) synthase ThiI [Clostridia bacterium]|nr:tRNA 4-thiouridine(8) synthase ThiI [Clostridia bacterium]
MKVILLRFGELYLKGDNRHLFESMLIRNIKSKLQGEQFKFEKTFGRYVISGYDDGREKAIVEKLKQVFGLYSLSCAVELPATIEAITAEVEKLQLGNKTFKVFVKRADKKFPLSSMDFAKQLGGVVLSKNHQAEVELYNPQVEIHIDIRLNGKAYMFYDTIKCQGGLPLGCAGRGLLLLSGGIDSPVAGYLVGKRGLEIEALHFHSYPYTSELARDKVLTLAKELVPYVGKIKLHMISFTKVQEMIHMNCSPEYMITIMRRIMMRIAERVCENNNLGAIVTGESLGQVASQTMQSMTVTGGVVKIKPIFRPCITMDKEEIMAVAQAIGTYETSILPYEDCCTVFLPKNPVIKPTIDRCEREEGKLNIEALVEECLAGEETIVVE